LSIERVHRCVTVTVPGLRFAGWSHVTVLQIALLDASRFSNFQPLTSNLQRTSHSDLSSSAIRWVGPDVPPAVGTPPTGAQAAMLLRPARSPRDAGAILLRPPPPTALR